MRVTTRNARTTAQRRWARLLEVGWCAALLSASACERSTDPGVRAHAESRSQQVTPPVIAVDVPAPISASTASRQLRRALAPACQALARERCDVRDEACQERMFSLARCVSARDGARPPLRFVSRNVLQRERPARTRAAVAPIGEAARLLGLEATPGEGAPAPQPLESASVARQSSSTNAYYAPRDRAVYFVSDDATGSTDETASATDETARLTLVHEYVHALQDRDGELLAVQRDRDEQTFDRELAAWSAFEGEATLCEELVRGFIHHRVDQSWFLQGFAERTRGTDGAIARQRRPLEASFATFPYTYGAYWAALEATRPLSTYEILARRHDWPTSVRSCADETPAHLAVGYPRRARDSLGAWLVQVYVRRHTGDAERARAAAQRWRGDWLSVYSRTASSTPSVVWQTCWDSPATAVEMRSLIDAQLRKSTAETVLTTQDAHRVTATVRGADFRARPGKAAGPPQGVDRKLDQRG